MLDGPPDMKFLVAADDDQKRRFPGLFADHRHQRLAGDGRISA